MIPSHASEPSTPPHQAAELPPTKPLILPSGLGDNPLVSFDPIKSKLERRVSTATAGDVPITATRRLDSNDDLRRGPSPAAPYQPDAAAPAYELHERIGVGGFGEVFEAVQTRLQRVVAIKRIRRDALLNLDGSGEGRIIQRMFRDEAVTAGLLDHPNILPIYDFDDTGEAPQMAMKLARGVPWDDLFARDMSRMAHEELLEKHLPILRDVAQAVAFAHSKGIVHRDLKMSQVMVGDFGEVLLMDWGLAVVYHRGAFESSQGTFKPKLSTSLDTASSPAGTPAYMAPEQTEESARGVGPWTDVYLLGGMLYELMTTERPHPGPGREETYRQARIGYVRPVEEAAPSRHNDPDLVRIAMKAMVANIPDRMQTSREFLNQLQSYLSGATRRRESQNIVAAVKKEMDDQSAGYEILADWHARLGQARALWGLHPEIEPLADTILSRHADLALQHGDLKLARVQADRIASDNLKAGILDRTARAETLAAQNAKIKKRAVRASFLLLFIVIVGGTLGMVKLYAANVRIKEEAVASWQANSQAEDALGGLGLNTARLARLAGNVQFAESTAKELLNFYSRYPERTKELAGLRARAGGDRLFAWVLDQQGKCKEAAEAANRAISDCREILRRMDAGERPTESEVGERTQELWTDSVRELAGEAYQELATALRCQGDYAAAAEAQRGAIEMAKQRLAAALADSVAMGDATLAGSLATAHLDEANYWKDANEYERQAKAIADARSALDKAKKLNSTGEDLTEYEATVLWFEGTFLHGQGQSPEAIAKLLAALSLMQQVQRKFPASPTFLDRLAVLHRSLADAYRGQGDVAAAKEHLLKGEPYARQYFATAEGFEPKTNLKVFLDLEAEVEEDLGNLPRALELAIESKDIAYALNTSLPGVDDYINNLAWSYCIVGRLNRKLGLEAEAIIAFEAGRDTLKPLMNINARPLPHDDMIGTYVFLLLYLGDKEGCAWAKLIPPASGMWGYPGFKQLVEKECGG